MYHGYVRPAPHRLNRCFFERCHSLRLHITLQYLSDTPVSVRELQHEEESVNDILRYLVGEGYVKSYDYNGRLSFRPAKELPALPLTDKQRSVKLEFAPLPDEVLAG